MPEADVENTAEEAVNPTGEENEKGECDTNPAGSAKTEGKRKLRVAVAGCVHGEIDKVYATMAELEKDGKGAFDLLLCCGDYESMRNYGDLHHIHVPEKYRKLETFYKYYSLQKKAPVLTVFVGGNHESSGYLAELPNGGWVAPNIYYMGFSNVVRFAGLRIAGLSGIFKGGDYDKGHYERPPFREYGSIISAYHVRSIDIFKFKQIPSPLDIFMSHDWPNGIWNYGDVDRLLRIKPHFTEDVTRGVMGNPHTQQLMSLLRPRYWFSAHMHVGFSALVTHTPRAGEETVVDAPSGHPGKVTRFLALDKPIPRRHFLQSLEMEVGEEEELRLSYDEEWLAILKSTDHLVSFSNQKVYLPSNKSTERYDFKPTQDELSVIRSLGDLRIPENFQQTAPPIMRDTNERNARPTPYYRNPQSAEFCTWLGIQDLNKILCDLDPSTLGMAHYLSEDSRAGLADVEQDREQFGDDDFIVDRGRTEDDDDMTGGRCPDEEDEGDEGKELDNWTPPVFQEKEEPHVNAGLDDWTPPAIVVTAPIADSNPGLQLKRRRVDDAEEED